METKLPVDAGLMSIMPESFVKRFNGDIDAGGGTTVGPFAKPQRLTVRVRRCWRGAFRFTRRVPAGERIYIHPEDQDGHDIFTPVAEVEAFEGERVTGGFEDSL